MAEIKDKFSVDSTLAGALKRLCTTWREKAFPEVCISWATPCTMPPYSLPQSPVRARLFGLIPTFVSGSAK